MLSQSRYSAISWMTSINRCFRDVLAGLIVTLAAMSFYISSAALLFQGQLETHLATGIGIALAGGAILALISAYTSSIALSSVGPVPATVPILAGMTGAIAAQCSAATALPTAVVALSIAAMVIGIVWFLLGHFKVGNVIRYIPYPVIGGFLAATGWLMLSGGLAVVAGEPFSAGLAVKLATHLPTEQIVAAIAIAFALTFATQRIKHVLLLPAMIVLSVLLIHAWFLLNGMDLAMARDQGWLMREFDLALPLLPFAADVVGAVNWHLLARESGVILSATIVSTMSLLLSDSSLEVAFDEQADFNRDLKFLGLGNGVLALFGGLTGGISISRSVLNREAGATGRMSGVVKAIACLLMMLVGGPMIAMIPKAVLGGLLMYLGLSVLKTWLVDGRRRLSRNDYLVVLTIVILTIGIGYLQAVIAGVLMCCIDFAVSSASLGPVRRLFSRNQWPGKIERSALDEAALHAVGNRMCVIELQGALFFGSIRTLALELESLMKNSDSALDQLIIDFRRVSAMDSSAGQAFSRISKMAGSFQVKLGFSSLTPNLSQVLKASGCMPADGPELFNTIDHAIQVWEDRHLHTLHDAEQFNLESWLGSELGSAEMVQNLVTRLERVSLAPGELLFEQGAPAEALYLVVQGRLSAFINRHGADFHVCTMEAGSTVGEMGLYRASTRSATVRAEGRVEVLRMTQSILDELEHSAPQIAIELHKLFLRLIATRLDNANAQANALSY